MSCCKGRDETFFSEGVTGKWELEAPTALKKGMNSNTRGVSFHGKPNVLAWFHGIALPGWKLASQKHSRAAMLLRLSELDRCQRNQQILEIPLLKKRRTSKVPAVRNFCPRNKKHLVEIVPLRLLVKPGSARQFFERRIGDFVER